MNARERLNATLNFENCTKEGGAVLETFYPWDMTVERWMEEGLPSQLGTHDVINSAHGEPAIGAGEFLDIRLTDSVAAYEEFFGFDSMRRMFLQPPLLVFEEEVLDSGVDWQLVRERSGKVVRRKEGSWDTVVREPVECREDWEEIKRRSRLLIDKYFTEDNIREQYGRYQEGHKRGDFSVRFAVQGFFWMPRSMFGIEPHMFAFYDHPELMHDMNEFMLDYYLKWLDKILDYVPADVLYIMEDLSGANGPMLSGECFDEFVGAYYRRLVPFLKSKGVGHVFVDTDGDFGALIPHFMDAGIEGFLPMDVNAGMDIVKVREQFPTLKFIGSYNKLEIAKGPAAIDREFERLLPVIRQGGYVPGCDHQVAPSTKMEDYQYYIRRLKEVMRQAGADR